jgi:hypothetical protein
MLKLWDFGAFAEVYRKRMFLVHSKRAEAPGSRAPVRYSLERHYPAPFSSGAWQLNRGYGLGTSSNRLYAKVRG